MQSSRHAWSRRARAHFGVAACVIAFSSTVTAPGRAQGPEAPSSAPDEPAAPDERPSADALGERVILLLRTPGDDETIARLRLELHESGWRILEVRADERSLAEPLGTTAERERVTAAVRVDAARGVVDLWVRRSDGPIEEAITAPGERSSGHVLALRAAEVLRARGLLMPPVEHVEVTKPPPPPPPVEQPATAPAPTPATPAHDRARFSLEAGPGLVLSPGGLGPLAVVDVGMRLEFGSVWSLSVLGLIPFTHQTVEAPEGEASIATSVIGGLLELEWARLGFGGFRSGVGLGGTVTQMSGTGGPGFQGTEDTVTALSPLARTSFHANLSSWLRLRTAVAAGAALPPVRIAFGSREVAHWGRPFVVASVALEASPLP